MFKQLERRAGRPSVGSLLALVLILLAAACGGNDDSSANGDSGDSTPGTGQEVPEDAEFDLDATVDIVSYSTFGDIDPHKERTSGDRLYWSPIYDTLVSTRTGTPEPEIATEWERSDDGLVWTFTIQPGIQFHDGTPLDAAAVSASIDRARTLADSTVAGDLSSIVETRAVGDLELEITTSEYDPKLLYALGGPGGAILNPTAIAAGNDFSRTPDGSGAYVATAIVPAESVTYERAETTYWEPEAARLAGFTVATVDDFDTALAGLQSDQYDAAWIVGLGDKIEAAVASDSSLVDEVLSPSTVLSLYLSNQRAPFDDVRVRQALSYAIDREGLTDALFNGGADCKPVSYNFPYEGDPLYIEGYDPYPYDPDKARDLLAEAGVESPSILYSDIGSSNDRILAEALPPMFEEIGFSVTARPGTTAALDEYRADEIDGVIVTNARQVYPSVAISRYWAEGGSYNSAGGEDQELQRLVDSLGDPDLSESEQAEIFKQITEETARLMTVIPVCLITNHVVHGVELTGFGEGATPQIPLNMRYVGVLADG